MHEKTIRRLVPSQFSGGFTLTELLVVIAIVATLAAVISVTTIKMRQKAKQTECASRLRSISVAIAAYGTDNAGKYPTSGDGDAFTGSRPAARWPFKISSYLGGPVEGDTDFTSVGLYSSRLFKCPLHDDKPGAVGVYGLNENLANELDSIRNVNVDSLAQFPLMTETGGLGKGGLIMRTKGPNPLAREYGWSGPVDNSGPSPNHGGKCHCLFGDGRIELRDVSTPNAWPWQDREIFKP